MNNSANVKKFPKIHKRKGKCVVRCNVGPLNKPSLVVGSKVTAPGLKVTVSLDPSKLVSSLALAHLGGGSFLEPVSVTHGVDQEDGFAIKTLLFSNLMSSK